MIAAYRNAGQTCEFSIEIIWPLCGGYKIEERWLCTSHDLVGSDVVRPFRVRYRLGMTRG
jgi:hypothetical protein